MNLSTLDPTARRVVETVLRYGPVSRIDMVERTGLSTGSLTRVTGPLVKAGILAEGNPVTAKVGRPTLPLEVVDAAASFVGIKVVPGKIYAVRTGFCGTVHGTANCEADTSSDLSTARAIASLLREQGEGWRPESIGVALAAAVDTGGAVRAANLLGWAGGDITGAVSEATGVSCVAANDVDALALAEHWFGSGRGTSNFAVVTVGTGVGSGAIVDNVLVVGHQGAAVMLGRAWLADGRTFHEVLATEPLLERASSAVGRVLDMADLLDDDPALRDIMDDAAAALGELVGLVRLAYGPERILVTGDGIAPLIDRRVGIRRGMERHSYYGIEPPELVMGGELDFFDWARGAATLAIRDALR